MMMKKNYRSLMKAASVLLLMLISLGALAQTRVVTGTIEEPTGGPLPGVNVVLKGSTTGTVSDAQGNFTIQATDEDILVFSFIGFHSGRCGISVHVPDTAESSLVELFRSADAKELRDRV